jgi:hypothetical protein
METSMPPLKNNKDESVCNNDRGGQGKARHFFESTAEFATKFIASFLFGLPAWSHLSVIRIRTLS